MLYRVLNVEELVPKDKMFLKNDLSSSEHINLRKNNIHFLEKKVKRGHNL